MAANASLKQLVVDDGESSLRVRVTEFHGILVTIPGAR